MLVLIGRRGNGAAQARRLPGAHIKRAGGSRGTKRARPRSLESHEQSRTNAHTHPTYREPNPCFSSSPVISKKPVP
jgi:hypothetical protein